MRNPIKLITNILSVAVIVLTTITLSGCSELALFDAKGIIGVQIADTMIYTVLLMLIVVIPTVILSVVVPYKFRESNKKNTYDPEWHHSNLIEAICWGIPIVIILFLAIETYKTSHSLDPHKDIVSATNPDAKPLKIQVVALNWKWLFIYPEEGIASVNEIAVPVDRPVQFLLTSDGAVNSFFIPRLGGQLYAMAGMESKINLIANEPGVYTGISANYSGYGFTGMRFKVHAGTETQYNKWIEKVREQGENLTDSIYNEMRKKSRDNPVAYYVNTNPLRFRNIIDNNTGLRKAQKKLDEQKKAKHDKHDGNDHDNH